MDVLKLPLDIPSEGVMSPIIDSPISWIAAIFAHFVLSIPGTCAWSFKTASQKGFDSAPQASNKGRPSDTSGRSHFLVTQYHASPSQLEGYS